ncbi:MAG: DPP IV N-terminal domain-containing protein [Porticoccaceae bacterium]|nr:DPP IV N-terminal domain-containing protein [Porticoccaceae bacterium]
MNRINQTSSQELIARYQRAEKLEQGVFSKKIAFNTTLYPHWIGDTDCFWYLRETRQGQTYRLVDAEAGSNIDAFDHSAVARALAQATNESVDPDNLPLTDLDLTQAPATLFFSAFGQRWAYSNETCTCQKRDTDPSDWVISPDGKKAAFARDYNIWIRDLVTKEEKALTEDGERFYEYASFQPMSIYGHQSPSFSLEAIWSPDSKRLFTHVIDLRKVGIAPPLVKHIPDNGSLRPTILDADRRVAFVGDKHIESYQFLTIEVDSGACQWADYPSCPVMYPYYGGYFSSLQLGWWDAGSQQAYFIDQERGGKVVNLVKLDAVTGETQLLFQETSDFAVTLIPLSHIRPLMMPLPESNELIWFSERSGSGHLYLYDLVTGELKHSITENETDSDPWLVRNTLQFDAKQRKLFIQTAGRVSGRNPYYCDIASVNIDTGELTTIRSTDSELVVCDQRSRIAYRYREANGVSPSGKYLVTTESRVDKVPVSLLLESDGNQRMLLEAADISGLPANFTWPEPVMLTAADNKTPIYAVVFRPSNFDPSQSYPVLDCTYHYASPVGSFSNNHTRGWHYLSAWAYAELGFITVMIFNRGNDGLRDTNFNSYQNPDFPQAPLNTCRCYKTDCIAGIQQLAERYPSMDINRVGVVEFGSTPTALMGMLVHPDFYKVCVSMNAQACSRLEGDIAPAHAVDTNLDKWPEFEQRAHQLQGKLLIINGMLDWCMSVTMTFRLIEALKNANKRFDMLLLPNLDHTQCGYTIQRSWDYVVEHLLGIKPPENFKLVSSFDGAVDTDESLEIDSQGEGQKSEETTA